PWLLERLDACAEGAGVDPLEFFAVSMEEIWYEPFGPRTDGRCSDLVAGPVATSDGHLLVAHNNDLRPEAEQDITALEISVPGDPGFCRLGGIPCLSAGSNAAGLSLTGNELSPNDERVGISRSHQVLEMMRASSLDKMLAMALRTDRASSYNNVLTSFDGGVANVEGSATDAEVTGFDERGHLAHTNNYVCDRMLPYEGDAEYAPLSQVRYERARELLATEAPASLTMDRLRELPSDHRASRSSTVRASPLCAAECNGVHPPAAPRRDPLRTQGAGPPWPRAQRSPPSSAACPSSIPCRGRPGRRRARATLERRRPARRTP